jgi:hypothetical protein
MQDLLQNLTVSRLTIPNIETSTTVSGVIDTQQYIFTPHTTLIVPYATVLGVSLVFLLFGLNALRQNGVSASSGGFMQILCTTRGSPILEEVASKGGEAVGKMSFQPMMSVAFQPIGLQYRYLI